jgi:hypothetical protein
VRVRVCPSQARLGAMESVVQKVQSREFSNQASVLVQGMAHLPGWDEKNFQVRGCTYSAIGHLTHLTHNTHTHTLTHVKGIIAHDVRHCLASARLHVCTSTQYRVRIARTCHMGFTVRVHEHSLSTSCGEQVMARQFQVIECLCKEAPTISKRDAYVAICGLVDKVRCCVPTSHIQLNTRQLGAAPYLPDLRAS